MIKCSKCDKQSKKLVAGEHLCDEHYEIEYPEGTGKVGSAMVLQPSTAVQDMVTELGALTEKYKDEVSLQEMLALGSQWVGKLVACQDINVLTPDMALEVIQLNVQVGNKEAIDYMFPTEGSA